MIAENQKVELFDEFYNWLVADGLKAKKSERLHRKKIFASLMANKEIKHIITCKFEQLQEIEKLIKKRED